MSTPLFGPPAPPNPAAFGQVLHQYEEQQTLALEQEPSNGASTDNAHQDPRPSRKFVVVRCQHCQHWRHKNKPHNCSADTSTQPTQGLRPGLSFIRCNVTQKWRHKHQPHTCCDSEQTNPAPDVSKAAPAQEQPLPSPEPATKLESEEEVEPSPQPMRGNERPRKRLRKIDNMHKRSVD